ncbi:hypothetical protein BH10BAC3_BH10BAC3_16140 [soil metagenome]
MTFNPKLDQGAELNNQALCDVFGCGPQGGMRRSHKTNTLVLISNHVESIYDDRWDGSAIHYTGMGQVGDQDLNFMQNKTLTESKQNGVAVFLFEVFKDKVYTFQGQVQLVKKPYQETQPDSNMSERLVWVFPLLLLSGSPIVIEEEELERLSSQKLARSKNKISTTKLKQIVEGKRKTTGKRHVQSVVSNRDVYITIYALRRAKGLCQLCDQPAPFSNRSGDPFLEVHHVFHLSKGGSDMYNNVVALCPNCHKKIHVLDRPTDVNKLIKAASKLLS